MAHGFVLAALGLEIERDISKAEWQRIGLFIARRVDGSAWALGDWLVEGGREGRQWYGGSTYDVAAKLTGYGTAYLSRCYNVSRYFTRSARHATLAWSVHAETMRLEPRLRAPALAAAVHERWGVEEMAGYVNKVLAAQAAAAGLPPPVPNVKRAKYYRAPKVVCPNCKTTFPIKGHKVREEL